MSDAVSANAAPAANGQEKASLRAWLGLGSLWTVVVYATVDRQIFFLLAEPIKQELNLSDGQLGLLQGIGLALISVLTTYPIAMLADRYDRRWVMAICIVIWSLAVIGCGLSPTFTWLFVFAALVGIGEAGAGPPSYAVVGDMFPESQRHIANSFVAIAGRLGSSLGIFLAGVLVTAAVDVRPFLPSGLSGLSDWRLGFLVAALFMPVAVFLILTLPKKASGIVQRSPASEGHVAPSAPLLPFLRRNGRAQLGFIIGFAFAYFGMTSVGSWIPVIAARDFHQTPLEIGSWLGAISLITTGGGFVIGLGVLHFLRPYFGLRVPMLAMAIAMVLSAASSVLVALAPTATFLYVAGGVLSTVLMIVSMATPTIIMNMTPTHFRARIYAIGSLVATAFGALSAPVVGLLSDQLGEFARPLVTAAVICAVVTLLISAALLLWTTPHYERLVKEVNSDQP